MAEPQAKETPKAKKLESSRQSFSIKDYIQSIVFVLKIFLRISALRSVIVTILTAVVGVKELVLAFMIGRMLDAVVVMAQRHTADINALIVVIAQYAIVVFTFRVLTGISAYQSRVINLIFNIEIDRIVYKKLYELGVQAGDVPELNNMLGRIRSNMYSIVTMFGTVIRSFSQFVLVIVTGAVLFQFLPIMIPVLVFLSVAKVIPDQWFIKRLFNYTRENSEEKRRIGNMGTLLEQPKYVAEISILNAYRYFDKAYKEGMHRLNQGVIKIRRGQSITTQLLNILDLTITAIGYFLLFLHFIAGQLSIGTLTFQRRAFDQFSDALEGLLDNLSDLSDFGIQFSELRIFLNMSPYVADGKRLLPKSTTPPQIELKNVTFRYPNSETNIFENLSLTINPGEKVAIVGHNGAGKTTFTKLLARTYLVSEGELTIGGINIKDLKIQSWYNMLGIMFQEYNLYPILSVKDNIKIGKLDRKLTQKNLEEAAESADIDEFVEKYPNKYDQLMSSSFKNGINPSTGQQQKIALARFFYRNVPVLIFDEPTSAVDAVSEAKIFRKIYEFFTGKTVIIISHRFSTVRNADRIIVMDKGQIVEQGTHEELLAMNGKYAHAFHLQAEGYLSKTEEKISPAM